MARIRTIKPEFFTSLTVTSLPFETRLTFVGLWTHADDEGRCVDDARLIKAALWPLDDRLAADVEADLQALSEVSLITRYRVGERSYLTVTNWHEHQKINRPSPSKLPEPPPAGSSAPDAEKCTCGGGGQPLPPAETSTCADFTETSVSVPVLLPEGSPLERKGTGNREQGKEQGTRTDASVRRLPSGDALFDEFWTAYPRREARGAARKAWDKAIKRAEPAAIIAGAARYRDQPGRDPRYTAHPATWLNADRWSDEPQPVAASRASGHQPYRNPEDASAYYGDL